MAGEGGGAGGGGGGLGGRVVGWGAVGVWFNVNDAPAAPYWAGMPAYTQLSWMLRSAGQALARWPVVPGSSPLSQRAQAPATLFSLASVGFRVSRLRAADLKYGRRVELGSLPWPRPWPLPPGFPRPPVPVVGAGCWGTCAYVYVGACVGGRLTSPFSFVSSARLMAFRAYSAASEAMVQSAPVVGSRQVSAASCRGMLAGSAAALSLAWQNFASSVAALMPR